MGVEDKTDESNRLTAMQVLSYYADLYVAGIGHARDGRILVPSRYETPMPGDLWPAGLLSEGD